MGVVIVSPNTRAPWNTKILSPVTRGLEGWFECDTDIARLGFNRAPSKPNAKIVGSPVVSSQSVKFKGLSNYLDTSIAETADMTIIVVGKSTNEVPAGASSTGDANTPMYAGTYIGPAVGVSGNSSGVSLYHVVNNSVYGVAARDNGSGAPTGAQIAAPDVANVWGLRAVRTGNGAQTQVQNLTTGTTASNAANTNNRIVTTNTLRIGSGYRDFGGEVDISQIIVFSVRLTDEELDLMAAFMRKRAASIGLSV